MANMFNGCANLDELKKAYKAAAKAAHPDLGGSKEAMQKVNADYEAMFETLKAAQNAAAAADTTGRTHATTETAGDFIAIIAKLLKISGITVELCGRWLWISGETFANKDALKEAGCKWSNNKKMWSWHFAEDGVAFHKTNYTMDRIRAKYGSTVYENGAASAALPA